MYQSLQFRSTCRLAAAAAFFVLSFGPLAAQDKRQNEPGQFDYYVLSLSWSPSYCEAATERAPERQPPQQQCGERPFHIVVHGLWPQYERGFPEYCQREAPRLDRNIVSSMLDLMPSPGLIFSQWRKHGTCAGITPRAYFDTVRRARAVVKIPEPYIEVKSHLMVSPAEVEEAFVKANPGMSNAAVAVRCDSKRLQEVRICLSKDLTFRDCPDVDRRACRREQLSMPPVRGS
jgi:ribonuclease T2